MASITPSQARQMATMALAEIQGHGRVRAKLVRQLHRRISFAIDWPAGPARNRARQFRDWLVTSVRARADDDLSVNIRAELETRLTEIEAV